MIDGPVALADPALELRGEAVRLRRWDVGDATFLALRLLVARCHRTNLGSIAAAERAGFRFERDDPLGFALYVCRA